MDSVNDRTPAICRFTDNLIVRLGTAMAWLNVVLVGIIVVQVVLRYAFGLGLVTLEELQWHLFGVLIMFGISYDLVVDRHVRLDLLHRKFSPKGREIVEILGITFLLMPMVLVAFIHGIDFTVSSFHVGESSNSPLGLPCRWLFKGVIPVSMFFVGIAAISRVIRAVNILVFTGKSGVSNAD